MDREKQVEAAAFDKAIELNEYRKHNSTSIGDMVMKAFTAGAEWADARPKQSDRCQFCKQERVATHKSKECDLSYDGETLCVDIDMPLTWGSATGYYGFSINYCPMCGRKLTVE